jgi:RimJ/RimL family protein N-acetyltransferase
MMSNPAECPAYSTERLIVNEWHELAADFGHDLVEIVCRVLTPATTEHLPPDWQGAFDRARAQAWVEQRDAESPTLLAIENSTGEAVGLLVVVAVEAPDGLDLRLGFVLAEQAWGKGLGHEMVRGLVDWAADASGFDSISGGVAAGNHASVRVLEKAGFGPVPSGTGERLYRRRLR